VNSQEEGPRARLNSAGLSRDIELLEALGSTESTRNGGLGVMQLAQLTGRDKAVVSRSLATLSAAGLACRDELTLNYRLGSRLYALAARTAESTLVHAARDHLRRISQATRETSHLCVLRGGNVLTLLSELSPYEHRTTGWEGVITAAWRTPSGRVLVSDWDQTSLAQWYEAHGHDAAVIGLSNSSLDLFRSTVLEQPPPHASVVSDFPSLMLEIGRIRAVGYAKLDEELEHGVVGASAPVYDFNGRVIAAVNVSAPKSRMNGQLDTLGALVARASYDLSALLGYRRVER